MKELQIELYSTFDNPYPFIREEGGNTLLIYPVLLKDYFLFHFFGQVLTIDKNSIPDVKVIQMPYLEYLIRNNSKENNYMQYLGIIIQMVMRKESIDFRYGFNEHKKPILYVDGVIYNHRDFDKIRHIICEQNLLELPNEKISKQIRDSIEEANRLRSKMSGTKMGSLEDQIIAVSISTGIPLSDMYEMTIRKFRKMIDRIDHKLHYEIYLSASMSGFVKFKDKNFIKHWLVDLNKNPLDSLMDYDDFEKKFSKGVQT